MYTAVADKKMCALHDVKKKKKKIDSLKLPQSLKSVLLNPHGICNVLNAPVGERLLLPGECVIPSHCLTVQPFQCEPSC